MKNKYSLNVLKYGYGKSLNPRIILSNIKQFFYNLKYAYQRIIYGFCEYDTFNLDYYYTELFYQSLIYFSNHLHGHPVNYNNEVEWKKYLTNMAAHFYNGIEDNENVWATKKVQEAYNKYINISEYNIKPDGKFLSFCVKPKDGYTEEDLKKAENEWMEAEHSAYQFRMEEIHKGLNMLDEVFFDLWD